MSGQNHTLFYRFVNQLFSNFISCWVLILKLSLSKRTILLSYQEFLVTFAVKTSEKMLDCPSRSDSGGEFLTFRNRTKNVEKFLSDYIFVTFSSMEKVRV